MECNSNVLPIHSLLQKMIKMLLAFTILMAINVSPNIHICIYTEKQDWIVISSPDIAFIKFRKDILCSFLRHWRYSHSNLISEMILHHFPKLNTQSLGSYYQTSCPTLSEPVLSINGLFYRCLLEKETLNKQNCQ